MTTRQELRRQGEAMRDQLFRDETDDSIVQGLEDLFSEAVYGAVWRRPGLGLPDRMLCALAALGALARLPQLRAHVMAALDLGLAPEAITETFIQCGIYAGFPTSENAIGVAAGVFAERGIELPEEAARNDPLDELTERGRALLEILHGSRGYEGYAAPDNKVTGALYPVAIQYGYGEIWDRPGLDRRQRALVAVAAFTALRLDGQVRKFGQSALNVGLSREEVVEAVIQTAPYGGFAPALNALAALSDALR